MTGAGESVWPITGRSNIRTCATLCLVLILSRQKEEDGVEIKAPRSHRFPCPPVLLATALGTRCIVFANRNLPSVMTRHAADVQELEDAAGSVVVLMLGRRGSCLATASCCCNKGDGDSLTDTIGRTVVKKNNKDLARFTKHS
ncbi:hypothetical protein KUCAC02_014781 [Chaenocephalus aceratus]|uniref:Uncharacterized protein n=1 Tax=Chaenocephalus aceratus TaxID=36190 RepID=A0ACB9WFV3_CHAAC|nr:hypothetical protein KUCAC02_014781 [Chaenocephalus aceratus]